jgi:hypothetical protein
MRDMRESVSIPVNSVLIVRQDTVDGLIYTDLVSLIIRILN